MGYIRIKPGLKEKGNEGQSVPGRGNGMCKVPEVERQIREKNMREVGEIYRRLGFTGGKGEPWRTF